jgi:hypothetical protein
MGVLMPTISQIRQVCRRHATAKCFVDSIPELKLNNARESQHIPTSEVVIALIDTTVFGSAKDGLAVCESGLYWKNIYASPEYATWSEFRVLRFQSAKSMFGGKVTFTDGRIFDLSGNQELVDSVDSLLRELQRLAIDGVAAPTTDYEWMVAVNQQQYGPYETESLKTLVAGEQIDMNVALVWREGMSNWSRFNDVPELITTKAQPASPPPVPPTRPNPPQLSTVEPILTEIASTLKESAQVQSLKQRQLVDLNNASLDDLLYLPGLALESARQLIHERQSRLGFQSVEEVGELLGFSPHKVQRLRERVRIEPFVGTGHTTSARRRVVDF